MTSQQTNQEVASATGLSFPRLLLVSNTSDSALFQAFWLVVRLAVGGLMIHNGLDKLADIQGFADGVVSYIGLPYPVFFTYCAAYIEVVSSVCIILGLLTRLNAMALLATMGVAIFFHIKGNGLKITPLEMASLYATSYTFLLINGPGQWSLDALIAKKFDL